MKSYENKNFYPYSRYLSQDLSTNILNGVPAGNIEKIMEICKIDDKTFETNFSYK